MKYLYLHIVYNPHLRTLKDVCREAEKKDFYLSHIVPVTEYEWVAVFEKEDTA